MTKIAIIIYHESNLPNLFLFLSEKFGIQGVVPLGGETYIYRSAIHPSLSYLPSPFYSPLPPLPVSDIISSVTEQVTITGC